MIHARSGAWEHLAVVFTGTYEHNIDSKNRIAIPSGVRSIIQSAMDGGAGGNRGTGEPGGPGVSGSGGESGGKSGGGANSGDSQAIGLYVTLGEGQSLYLYTQQGHQERAKELLSSQGDLDQLLGYERLWFSLTEWVFLDKAGRLRLPESLVKRAKLDSEVVLLGVNDHMEIRDRTTWQAYVQQVLDEQPQLLVNPRRVIHKPSV